MAMIGFKKFDPRAFLEGERLAPRRCERAYHESERFVCSDDRQPLASLATLATSESICGLSHDAHCQIHEGNEKTNDASETETPAKVAKTPKLIPCGSPDDPNTQQERAAIIEYDGLAPHSWAKALARLDCALPPRDVPANRWVQFIDDCGHFIDVGWDLRAAELGWTAFDLFGCDRFKPFARIGRCGLLWLLAGRHVRILTTDTALMSGSNLTFYRRPHEPGQVLAWELTL
jgi:hypothetical protein